MVFSAGAFSTAAFLAVEAALAAGAVLVAVFLAMGVMGRVIDYFSVVQVSEKTRTIAYERSNFIVKGRR